LAPSNDVTNLYTFDSHMPHPGDSYVPDQDKFIAEMKRVIGA
jgi:hypothetical protein